MIWNANKDVLSFTVRLNFSLKVKKIYREPDLNLHEIPGNIPVVLTRRMLLSQINGIYDPLGLISPYTVRAKILMKDLWKVDKQIGWEDPIPDGLRDRWIELFSELNSIEDISFKRCLKPVNAVGDPILITFCDGSESACSYVRWTLEDGTYEE